jgi:hypothetical protein
MTFCGFDFWAALLWGLTTLVYAWVAAQLWNVRPQGWLFLVIISIWDLVLAFFALLGGTTFSALAPSILINALILIYCLTPGVRRAFGTESLRAA